MVETIEEQKHVGFKIEGEYFTSLMRDLVREGQWRRAYDILLDGLDGISTDTVLNLLRGTQKLVGVNDLDIEQDDAESAVKAWLDYQFRNCFIFRERIYRPYGYVGAFQEKDYALAQCIARGEDEQMCLNRVWRKADTELSEEPYRRSYTPWGNYRNIMDYRPAYYARNRSRDICIMVNLTKVEYQPVMCEEVEADVPLWYKLPTKAADVIRQAYANNQLPDLFDWTRDDLIETAKNRPKLQNSAEERSTENETQKIQVQQTEDTRSTRIVKLRADIGAFADADAEYGWLELSDYDEEAGRKVQLRVPRRAFICAALDRAKARHLMPEYAPRCPSGLKLMNDDPFHSDAWIGAGMEVEDAYNGDIPEQRLFMSKLYELQRKLLGFSFDVLARNQDDFICGTVIHNPELADKDKILVLKAAAPEYAPAALKCKAVIVETGSKLAHLVVVSREESVPVIRAEDALLRFPAGRTVSIDFDAGKVSLEGF